jgi:hypothetical protein
MSEFLSKITGFNPEYAKAESIKQKDEEEKDEFDYSDVDFCQGEEITELNGNIFGAEFGENYKNYDNDESIFKFD